MKPIEKAYSVINHLGKTSYEVAYRLRFLGIRGVLASASSCPLARYAQSMCSRKDIRVGAKSIHLAEELLELPDGPKAFLEDFDLGKYPDLQEPY